MSNVRQSSALENPNVEPSIVASCGRHHESKVTEQIAFADMIELAMWLRANRSTAEGGAYITPARMKGNQRNAENAASAMIVGADFDDLTPESHSALIRGAKKYSSIVYETRKSTADNPRVRVIVQASQPIAHDDYEAAHNILIAQLSAVAGVALIADQHCNKSEQPLFTPVAGREVHVFRGNPFTPRGIHERPQAERRDGASAPAGEFMSPGSRNSNLTRLAGSMRRMGASESQIESALSGVNADASDPLPARELKAIARSVARYEPSGSAKRDWQPPSMHSYGPSFDPAAIPLRRWLVGKRRSVGEVTIDLGPPGVNKSTLLVTDAIAIVTGKTLLHDEIVETGDVLMFIGEDARRDVEARIAAILQHYRIDPADLADRLHVVYLAEVEPRTYSLAQMVDSVGEINRQMMDWIEAFPNLIAVFIDPIAAWHDIVENDNGAMKVLSTALRGLAVRANIHIGYDHHTTKASQIDPEAHVGNLVSLRGAYLGGEARWIFTMAKLRSETATRYGIADDERWLWRRLDPLKASYGPDDQNIRLVRIRVERIANGEDVALLIEPDIREMRRVALDRQLTETVNRRTDVINALKEMLDESCPRSLTDAAKWMRLHHPDMFPGKKGKPLCSRRLTDRLVEEVGLGLLTERNGERVWIEVESVREGRAARKTLHFSHKERKG